MRAVIRKVLIGIAGAVVLLAAGWATLYLAAPDYLACAYLTHGVIPSMDAYCAETVWCADHAEAFPRECASARFPLTPDGEPSRE